MAVLPAGWASVYSSSSVSYILPSAECDLKLTMFDKGLLNSMSFAGKENNGIDFGKIYFSI